MYFTVAQFPLTTPPFDRTWFNIAIPLIIASIVGFLFLAYLIYANRCYGCITAKKAIIVSLIFLSGGWAAWSLGRLLDLAVITFQFSQRVTPIRWLYLPFLCLWSIHHCLHHQHCTCRCTRMVRSQLHHRQLLHRLSPTLCLCCFSW